MYDTWRRYRLLRFVRKRREELQKAYEPETTDADEIARNTNVPENDVVQKYGQELYDSAIQKQYVIPIHPKSIAVVKLTDDLGRSFTRKDSGFINMFKHEQGGVVTLLTAGVFWAFVYFSFDTARGFFEK